jgi:glycerol-3-phosphate acyltransferase PlsX
VAEPEPLGRAVQELGLRDELDEAVARGLLQILPSGPSVGMNDEATVVRRKRDASINLAMDLVKRGEAMAVYSAGNSGAVMASAIFRLGRLPGIDRPAIGALFPTRDPEQQVLVLDVGANMDCKPEWLLQFALLGNIYSRDVLQVKRPRVGLVNIGEEECKGNDLCLRSYPLLAAEKRLQFAGNCEGRDILSGAFDVVVCDGYTGNVLLKFLESVGGVLLDVLRAELPRGRRGKVGSAFLRSNLIRIKKRLDHAEHGGALLLGVDGICVIGHGSSKALSVLSALRLAHSAASHGVMEDLHALGAAVVD